MKRVLLLVLGVLVLGVFAEAFFLYEKSTREKNNRGDCIVARESKIVDGISLEPLLNDGQTVETLRGYYSCNTIQRRDVVLYDFRGNTDPLIKIVYGIPGDTLDVRNVVDNKWNILIDGAVLKNSEGIAYAINAARSRMVSLYKGKIPEDAYLILGNDPGGSVDSSLFGLVGKSAIIGKVEYESKKNN